MEKIFDIAKDSEQKWGVIAQGIDGNFDDLENNYIVVNDNINNINGDLNGENTTFSKEWDAIDGAELYTTSDKLVVNIPANTLFNVSVLRGVDGGVYYYVCNGVSILANGKFPENDTKEFTFESPVDNIYIYMPSPLSTGKIGVKATYQISNGIKSDLDNVKIRLADVEEVLYDKNDAIGEESKNITNVGNDYIYINKHINKSSIVKIKVTSPEDDSSTKYIYAKDEYNQDVCFYLIYNDEAILYLSKDAEQLMLRIDNGELGEEYSIKAYLANVNKYTFADALTAWQNGDKFPVGFYGDSTTDGVSTTGWDANTNGHAHQDDLAGGVGKADYVCELAYPKLLQNLLRSELNSDTLRIYNIGYSGGSFQNNSGNIEQILSNAYSDVKMVGIVLGINDRVHCVEGTYYGHIYSWCKNYALFMISKGITPFIVTNQPVFQAGELGDSSYNQMYQNSIQTICNSAKIAVAKELDLQIIDMYAFGELLFNSSSYSGVDISEGLHFKDLGHQLEAQFLFTQFIPWVKKTGNKQKVLIGLYNTNFKCDIAESYHFIGDSEFGQMLNYVKDNAEDVCIYDAYVFNNSIDGAYTATYCTPQASGYIVIDGNINKKITIDDTEMQLGVWDIGLHHIQVYTGASTTVAFKGIRLTR